MKITYESLLGKVMLIGLTFYDHNDNMLERKQLWGTVTEANENKILVEQKNGETFSLPPDLSAVREAPPGEYRLHSTGEIVENPDFLTTWNVTRPDDNKKS